MPLQKYFMTSSYHISKRKEIFQGGCSIVENAALLPIAICFTYLKLLHLQIYNNFALSFGISLAQRYPIFVTVKKTKEFTISNNEQICLKFN